MSPPVWLGTRNRKTELRFPSFASQVSFGQVLDTLQSGLSQGSVRATVRATVRSNNNVVSSQFRAFKKRVPSEGDPS